MREERQSQNSTLNTQKLGEYAMHEQLRDRVGIYRRLANKNVDRALTESNSCKEATDT